LVLLFPRFRLTSQWVLPVILTFLAVVDVWGVSARLVHPRASGEDVKRVLRATPAEKWLKDRDEHLRIIPLGDKARSNRFLAHGISSVMGYYPAKMARYDELIQRRGLENLTILRMLNCKYILAPGRLRTDQFHEVASFGSEYLYEIPGALPRAWFVGQWDVVDEAESLDRVLATTFRPDSIALLESDPELRMGGTGHVVDIRQISPEQLEVAVEVREDALLVFSEVFYEPGWNVLVDATETTLLKADYLLCAVAVPQGSKRVTLYYESRAESMGETMSLCGWILLIATCAGGWLSNQHSRREIWDRVRKLLGKHSA
jgi:hypothetical protein